MSPRIFRIPIPPLCVGTGRLTPSAVSSPHFSGMGGPRGVRPFRFPIPPFLWNGGTEGVKPFRIPIPPLCVGTGRLTPSAVSSPHFSGMGGPRGVTPAALWGDTPVILNAAHEVGWSLLHQQTRTYPTSQSNLGSPVGWSLLHQQTRTYPTSQSNLGSPVGWSLLHQQIRTCPTSQPSLGSPVGWSLLHQQIRTCPTNKTSNKEENANHTHLA